MSRWLDMAVDPDGFLWLRPATRSSRAVTAYVLDPNTSAVDTMSAPAFPAAFGRPGEYYAIRLDTVIGVHVIEKLVIERP